MKNKIISFLKKFFNINKQDKNEPEMTNWYQRNYGKLL